MPLGALLASSIFVGTPLAAQTLTPRAYWPAPVGTNVISIGYSYQTGDVVTDPSLPVEDVDSETHGIRAGYLRFFSLAGRTASLSVEIPRGESNIEGLLAGEGAQRTLSGYSDLTLRLAANLHGAPAMTPEEFREFVENPEPVLGASLRVHAPTGSYNDDKLVNLGTNRWSTKPEIGYLHGFRGWITELTAGVRFFGDNTEFQGQTLEQNPLASAEFHIGRAVRQTHPNFWISFDINYIYGGRTRIDGVEKNDLQQNSRVGVTMAFPVGKGQLMKFAASTSLKTAVGGDYDAWILAYSKAWR